MLLEGWHYRLRCLECSACLLGCRVPFAALQLKNGLSSLWKEWVGLGWYVLRHYPQLLFDQIFEGSVRGLKRGLKATSRVFLASRLLELVLMAIQGSLNIWQPLVSSEDFPPPFDQWGKLLTGTVFPLCDNVPEGPFRTSVCKVLPNARISTVLVYMSSRSEATMFITLRSCSALLIALMTSGAT